MFQIEREVLASHAGTGNPINMLTTNHILTRIGQQIDQMFAEAFKAGAIGGKITGAGGGGFLLLFVPPTRQERVKETLRNFLHVPFKFDHSGSQIIFADSEVDYSDAERIRKVQEIKPFAELSEL